MGGCIINQFIFGDVFNIALSHESEVKSSFEL